MDTTEISTHLYISPNLKQLVRKTQ